MDWPGSETDFRVRNLHKSPKSAYDPLEPPSESRCREGHVPPVTDQYHRTLKNKFKILCSSGRGSRAAPRSWPQWRSPPLPGPCFCFCAYMQWVGSLLFLSNKKEEVTGRSCACMLQYVCVCVCMYVCAREPVRERASARGKKEW